VAAAVAHGLVVTNTPDVLSDCTADMAMLLILGACRRAS
jgi:lactate dehydrogenase-like 2-hydroxyacid dehydrogenase